MNKLMSMKDAIKHFVNDGDSIYMAGFTHGIPFAAAHEIIRQKKKDLTLIRATPDLIYDQLIAAGCAKKVVFSYAGNPGVGHIRAFKRAIEEGTPNKIEIEEYTHFDILASLYAGASKMPFYPMTNLKGSDVPKANPKMKTVISPYDGKEYFVVPPLNPDVAVVHAQRASKNGTIQSWGIMGDQKEAAFASKRVIVSVEEIVDDYVIQSDPNRILIPSFKVDSLVLEPFGAHPSYMQGYYDRDNEFYIKWDEISKTQEGMLKYFEEFVFYVKSRTEYIEKIGISKFLKLKPKSFYSVPVDYGIYE